MTSTPPHLQTLLDAGLRLTSPRTEIARVLFGDGQARHVTADWIAAALDKGGKHIALGTIYNTLRHFLDLGLVREVHGTRTGATIFDTNTHPHHHIYDETTGQLTDISAVDVSLADQIDLPEGKTVSGYDVVIRVR